MNSTTIIQPFHHTMISLLVQKILEQPQSYSWSLQGLGMLRLYLSTEIRLHIWDSRYAIPNVSTIHNHPWDFKSYIVKGTVEQNRFTERETAWTGPDREDSLSFPRPYMRSTLKCGAGNCERSEPVQVWLERRALERYTEGMAYTQTADEIHDSIPEDGTITLVTRKFTREDVDHAQVYWPSGEEWVSAEPRPATFDEVNDICASALNRWFPINH